MTPVCSLRDADALPCWYLMTAAPHWPWNRRLTGSSLAASLLTPCVAFMPPGRPRLLTTRAKPYVDGIAASPGPLAARPAHGRPSPRSTCLPAARPILRAACAGFVSTGLASSLCCPDALLAWFPANGVAYVAHGAPQRR